MVRSWRFSQLTGCCTICFSKWEPLWLVKTSWIFTDGVSFEAHQNLPTRWLHVVRMHFTGDSPSKQCSSDNRFESTGQESDWTALHLSCACQHLCVSIRYSPCCLSFSPTTHMTGVLAFSAFLTIFEIRSPGDENSSDSMPTLDMCVHLTMQSRFVSKMCLKIFWFPNSSARTSVSKDWNAVLQKLFPQQYSNKR